MCYIISTLLRKAIEDQKLYENVNHTNDLWKKLMLGPYDYSSDAIKN